MARALQHRAALPLLPERPLPGDHQPEKEARLIADGCTEELRGTIKPDIVLHGDRNLLEAALTLDFKFPCPGTNQPQWTPYGPSSPYFGQNQGQVYKTALGGQALLISPRFGVRTP
ncbi:hypothetical protein [Corallococcus sp. CA041A]|uniref:hypothetical protein n=1 Tax=Corallococcus sp. CA041A TaxID=2316727 RepID=UPI001F2958A9|nr:hypothetical protein [Corallococcus sp. CA041A]